MFVPFVDLKKQYREVKSEVMGQIGAALEGMQLFLGDNVERFEAEFARYCGTEFAIGVGSGTEALHLALAASGVGQGDEVITVSNTFFATAEAIALTGARPVFVDIDPVTFTMDPAEVERKITNKTRAILPVHLYGHPVDIDPIRQLAQRLSLTVIEDACQAHGAEYNGSRCGSLGDAGCFSFYFTKNLGAYGEAGMVVTSDPEIARQCRMLRNHGQEVRYYHHLMGVNGRLDEIHAATLRVKLPHLDRWNESRRNLAEVYDAMLPEWLTKPQEMPWAKHVYHLYVVRTTERDSLRAWLEGKGVATGIHYPVPIHLQQACRRLHGNGLSLPVTEKAVSEILSLPMYPELDMNQLEYVCDCVREFGESKLKVSSALSR